MRGLLDPLSVQAPNFRASRWHPRHQAPRGASCFLSYLICWVGAWVHVLGCLRCVAVLQFLSPQVETFMTSFSDSVPDEAHVVSFMKGLTLVGVLPVPHPIITRRYQPNQYTSLWFTTFLWGVVFLRSQGESGWEGRGCEPRAGVAVMHVSRCGIEN
jgi:hypothetical protein